MANNRGFEEVVSTYQESDEGNIQLRVLVTKTTNQPYIDLRNYWLPPGQSEFKPTKKGVRIHAENLEQLIADLQKANTILEERGT